VTENKREFQARTCNTLAFRAVARSATHRYRVRRPAPWPRARTGARTAKLPWRGGGVSRGKGCRRRRRSGGGPPAWCSAYGRGRHTAAQRTCARPTRRTGGRMESTTARRGASNRTGRWRQQPPTRRRHRCQRAGTITPGSSWALQTPEVGRHAQLGGRRGAGAL